MMTSNIHNFAYLGVLQLCNIYIVAPHVSIRLFASGLSGTRTTALLAPHRSFLGTLAHSTGPYFQEGEQHKNHGLRAQFLAKHTTKQTTACTAPEIASPARMFRHAVKAMVKERAATSALCRERMTTFGIFSSGKVR